MVEFAYPFCFNHFYQFPVGDPAIGVCREIILFVEKHPPATSIALIVRTLYRPGLAYGILKAVPHTRDAPRKESSPPYSLLMAGFGSHLFLVGGDRFAGRGLRYAYLPLWPYTRGPCRVYGKQGCPAKPSNRWVLPRQSPTRSSTRHQPSVRFLSVSLLYTIFQRTTLTERLTEWWFHRRWKRAVYVRRGQNSGDRLGYRHAATSMFGRGHPRPRQSPTLPTGQAILCPVFLVARAVPLVKADSLCSFFDSIQHASRSPSRGRCVFPPSVRPFLNRLILGVRPAAPLTVGARSMNMAGSVKRSRAISFRRNVQYAFES